MEELKTTVLPRAFCTTFPRAR